MNPPAPRTLRSRFRAWQQRLRESYGGDISTPAARRRAWWHFHLVDHALVRVLWWNFYEIAPGVWRSNQPSPARLLRYKRMGIRAVINLRGGGSHSSFLFEREACRELGLSLHNVTLSARALLPRDRLLALVALMRRAERPFVFHCKSGSDRAGFAAAIYLAAVEGMPVTKARRQLHWRFLHSASGESGILDHVFDTFEAEARATPIDFETWLRTRYDAEALTESWQASRA